MILVVFSHVEAMGLDLGSNHEGINNLFKMFRMPLFFFVSGFIAYRIREVWNWEHYRNSMLKKMRVQLIPMLFFGILFTLTVFSYKNNTTPTEALSMFFFTQSKLGYWFTEVLLEMFIIYYTVSFLMRKRKLRSRQIVLIIIAVCFFVLSLFGVSTFSNNNVLNCLSIYNLLLYFQFFIFGNLASCYREKVFKILDNKYVITIILLLLAATFIIYYHQTDISQGRMYLSSTKLLAEGLAYLGITTVIAVFRHYEDFFSQNTKIGRGLQYIGRRTLDIYLLHFFLIPSIPQIGLFFKSYKNLVLEATTVITLSLLVILFCLIISNIIRISPFLAHYLFGVKKKEIRK